MKVIVNGIPLLSLRTGVGNYVYETFRAMSELGYGDQLCFYYGFEWSGQLKDRPERAYTKARGVVRHLGRLYGTYRRALDLSFLIGQQWKKFDVYHETNYVPMPFDGPTVITVFDLSFHLYPETHPRERIRYLTNNFYARLDRASHFIAISEATKSDMIKHLGLATEKITVTHLGVDESFKPVEKFALQRLLAQYGLMPGGYILYSGTLEPRKNISTILNAYAHLPVFLRDKYPLVLSGGAGWLSENLDQEIRKLGIQSTTIKTGYVPREDLLALYSGAGVFVYPSLYEGFGLPPLEAMACGAPVITSNTSSLPEVVGNAGILISPHDTRLWKENIERVLTNPEERLTLREKCRTQAHLFSWKECARKTLEVYHKVSS